MSRPSCRLAQAHNAGEWLADLLNERTVSVRRKSRYRVVIHMDGRNFLYRVFDKKTAKEGAHAFRFYNDALSEVKRLNERHWVEAEQAKMKGR